MTRLPNDLRARVYRSRDGWWVRPPWLGSDQVTGVGPFPSWGPAYLMARALVVGACSADVIAEHRARIYPLPPAPPPPPGRRRRRSFFSTRPPL